MNQYPNAAAGLQKVFASKMLAIIATVLSAMPHIGFIGNIVAFAGFVLYLMGLKKAGEDAESYNKAVTLVIVNIVIVIVEAVVAFIPFVGSILVKLLYAVSLIIDLMIINTVITTTGGLLNNVGAVDIAANGLNIYKLYVVCTIINVICSVLGLIPLLKNIVGILSFVAFIVMIVVLIRYLIFLYKSASALGA